MRLFHPLLIHVQVVLLVYIVLTIKLWPFAASEDNWLQLASLTGERPCGCVVVSKSTLGSKKACQLAAAPAWQLGGCGVC